MAQTETLRRKLIQLVLPISFQQFMLALVGASDAFMLGRLDQNSMSAVSLASQTTFVFNLFMAAFMIGENMFVAQYYGKKDYDNISRVFGLVLLFSCSVAILFVIGAMCFPEAILFLFTDEQELVHSMRGAVGSRIVGVVTGHPESCEPDADGNGVSEKYASDLFLLPCRKVGQQHDDRRHFSGRGRRKVRTGL